MKVEQISVFLENASGRLAEVAEVLARGGVDIRALSLADMADFGILRLIVRDPARAAEVLRAAGFTVGRTEVIAVEIRDRPGGMAGILAALRDAGVDIEYLYAFVHRSGEDAVLIFRCGDPERAAGALTRLGVRILGGEDVETL